MYWPKLRSLRLDCSSYSQDDHFIVDFLERHAKTLRSVILENFQLTNRGILKIRSLRLSLNTFRVTSGRAKWGVDEQNLCAFITGATESCQTERGVLYHTDPNSSATYATHELWGEDALDNPNQAEEGEDDSTGWESDDEEHDEGTTYNDDMFNKKEVLTELIERLQDQTVELGPKIEWSFVHRDGRRAVGDDPLEYFSDWDSDAGDKATCFRLGRIRG